MTTSVTIIGAGLGGLILARALQVSEYERDLFRRSARLAAESERNHQLLFGDNTPASLIDVLTGQEPAL